MSEHESALFKLARAGFERAYAPYSNFSVGAALLADDGQFYGGSNVENAAYPQGSCAEAGAISAMIFGGGQRIISLLVYAAGQGPVFPCGGCRQRIAEFGDEATNIFIASPEGVGERLKLADLLPHGFLARTLPPR